MSSCSNTPVTKICDLYKMQSEFSDKDVQIVQLKVVRCTGVLSASMVELTDGECSIRLFTTKPYTVGEIVDIEAKYMVLLNYDEQTVSFLVTDDFPLHPDKLMDLLPIVTRKMFN